MNISIMNEYDSVMKSLDHFNKLRDEFDKHALMHYKKSIGYFIDKYLFRIEVTKLEYDIFGYYYLRFKYQNYTLNQIDGAIERLSKWKFAIERKNNFTINSYEYDKFLEYVNLIESEEV